MARSERGTPVHEQTDFAQGTRIPYRKMRKRSRLAQPPRRRPIFDVAISMTGLESLRSRVAAWLNLRGAARIREDVVLVAHELATNVIRHGGGIGRLRMWRESGRIVCRVTDSGLGMPARVAEPEVRRPGGRGLWIARRLADVRIETGPSGTVVEAALAL